MVQNETGVVQPSAQLDLAIKDFGGDSGAPSVVRLSNPNDPLDVPDPEAEQAAEDVSEPISGGVVSVKAWGNLDMQSDTGDAWLPHLGGGKFSEVRLSSWYSRSLGPVDGLLGVASYILPGGPFFANGPRSSTTEFFASVGKTLGEGRLWAFRPAFELRYDGDQANGIYLNAGITKSFVDILDNLDLLLGLASGWSDEGHSEWTYGLSEDGFADVQATATLSYHFDEITTMSLGVGASTVVDEELRDWFDIVSSGQFGSTAGTGVNTENIWVNLSVGWSF